MARVALLFMDLDNFKRVNDSLGHHAGDHLLVMVAERVASHLRPGDTFARFGGDEFTVLLDEADETSNATGLAERIVGELHAPFVIDGQEIYTTASIGIVLSDPSEVVSFEALVRWEHPEHGLLDPAEFISLAEETGLIMPLGHWVLEEACRQARIFKEFRGRTSRDAPLKMFVNLSARQFRHPALVEEVARVLSETGLDSGDLALEITESVMMDEETTAQTILRELKKLGVTLAMDDFGTGYSSLAFLKKFPVDVLKVDRTMVKGVEETSEDSAIVSAIVSLAHALELKVVAEGVETFGELERLRSLGCDFGQGYYWRKPCPAREAMELLATG